MYLFVREYVYNVCVCVCVCAYTHVQHPDLFNHVSDFSLLALEHVIQLMDLLFEPGQVLLQLLRPTGGNMCPLPR